MTAQNGAATLAYQIQHGGVVIVAVVRNQKGFGRVEDFNAVFQRSQKQRRLTAN
jgi:hypothetical protein